MNTTTKPCAYGAVLVLLLAGGYGIGAAVAPVPTASAAGGVSEMTGDLASAPGHHQGAPGTVPTVAAPNAGTAPNAVAVSTPAPPAAVVGGHGH